jgi:hypothetical protein
MVNLHLQRLVPQGDTALLSSPHGAGLTLESLGCYRSQHGNTPHTVTESPFASVPSGQAPDVDHARVHEQLSVPVHSYEIVRTLPHDAGDYTEGLFRHKGYLYEATGEFGRSTLKKSDIATGKVLCESDLDIRYLCEGVTALGDKVYRSPTSPPSASSIATTRWS